MGSSTAILLCKHLCSFTETWVSISMLWTRMDERGETKFLHLCWTEVSVFLKRLFFECRWCLLGSGTNYPFCFRWSQCLYFCVWSDWNRQNFHHGIWLPAGALHPSFFCLVLCSLLCLKTYFAFCQGELFVSGVFLLSEILDGMFLNCCRKVIRISQVLSHAPYKDYLMKLMLTRVYRTPSH